MKSEHLRLCPFCGSSPEVVRSGTRRRSMIISCKDCGATVESGDVTGCTPDDALAWNQRHLLAYLQREECSCTPPVLPDIDPGEECLRCRLVRLMTTTEA